MNGVKHNMAFLMPTPSCLIRDVVRNMPKNYKMIDTSKRSEYDYIHNALSILKLDLLSVKANANVNFDVRFKTTCDSFYRNLNNDWFKEDQLSQCTTVLEQFETVIEKLLTAETVSIDEVNFVKEAQNDFKEWMHTHKELISFTYVYYTSIKKILTSDDAKVDNKLLELIDLTLTLINQSLEEVQTIKLASRHLNLVSSDRESKLNNLMNTIHGFGVLWK